MKFISEISMQNNISEPKRKKYKRVPFSGNSAAELHKLYENDLTRRVLENKEKFLKTMPWYVRLADYFSHEKFKGDIANVIITGLGTGIVAPVMIKYNPLSKEDKDTKTYAAWRQPISAVIAVVTQVGITKQVGVIIKKMAAKGELGKEMDTRISNRYMALREKYLKWAEKLGSLAECHERAEFLKSFSDHPLFKGIHPAETNSKERVKTFIKNLTIKIENKLENKLENKNPNYFKKQLETLKSLDTPEKRNEYLLKEIEKYTQRADKYKAKAEKITGRINKYKEMIGIGIALITLPFACGLLNWVYPRFMKWAFPELSNKKESKKEVDNNPSFAKEIKPNAEELKK